ncbi:MAG TPA: molybdopterin molybdenumtransferase MoeA, partial [Beijerinckiaceae bacterium]|nr:molybdopterin molybdenumtransferase MoeA [Beijerinckiaceae bacterium]
MAQLSDDCFAFGGPLMTVDEAIALIGERIQPVAGEDRVGSAEACGRILAEPVTASVAVPSFDNSAVDGYAVRHADLAAEGVTTLPVSARIAAGCRTLAPLTPGTAARIFTGAPMPEGADTVFMQEDVQEDGGRVTLPPGLKQGANRRFAGEDFKLGAEVLAAGTRLDPRH